MFTLIEKEIRDCFAVIATITIFTIVWLGYNYYFKGLFGDDVSRIFFTNVSVGCTLPAFAIFLGLTQSSNDVNYKHSNFLMSMPVTRRQLYLARIVAGSAVIVFLCLTGLIFTCMMISEVNNHEKYDIFSYTLVFKWYLFVLGVSVVSYGHGVTWGGYKDIRLLFSIIGSIILFLLPIYVVYLKGMGLFSAVLLVIWTAVILYAGYDEFEKKAL